MGRNGRDVQPGGLRVVTVEVSGVFGLGFDASTWNSRPCSHSSDSSK